MAKPRHKLYLSDIADSILFYTANTPTKQT